MAFDEITRVPRACPICAGTHHTPLAGFSRNGWSAVTCDSCGFAYLNEAPVYEALSEALAWTQQFEKEKKAAQTKSTYCCWDRPEDALATAYVS